MRNEFIKDVCIGHGPIVDFKRVNNEYGIGITQEMCRYEPFTGLFKLDILFGEKDVHITIATHMFPSILVHKILNI